MPMVTRLDAFTETGEVFEALFEYSAEAMLLLEGEQFVACNAAAVAMLGYPNANLLLGAHPREISPSLQPDGQPSWPRIGKLLAEASLRGSQRFEWQHRRYNGEPIFVEVLLTPLSLADRDLVLVTWHDIGERVREQAAMQSIIGEYRQELARRRQITQAMHDILTLLTSSRPLDAILAYTVGHAMRLLDADAVAIYRFDPNGQTLHLEASQGSIPADLASTTPLETSLIGQSLVEGRPLYVADLPTWQAERTPGGLSAVLVSFASAAAVPLRARDQLYGVMVIYFRQSHSFMREEAQLIAACGDYAALAIENAGLRLRLEQAAAAAERSRLARDLHDAVSQTLFSASLIADALPRIWEGDHREGLRRLDELRWLTHGALAEMRTLLLELRPDGLAEVPFGDLLRLLAEAVSRRSGFPISLQLSPGAGDICLPPAVQENVYRITQEALNNMARHARAGHAWIECYFNEIEERDPRGSRLASALRLSLRDDGCGFDPTNVAPGHLGLCGIRERAAAIGALLNIESALGQGTCLTLIWAGTGAA